MPTVYVDYRTRPDMLMTMNLLIRARGDLGAAAGAVRAIVQDIDPLVPVEAAPLRTYLAASVADRRLMLGLIGAFAAISLALAAVGVYAMFAFVVGRRWREMSIRMSLGARPGEVVRRSMRNGLLPAAAGIGAGMVAALMAGRVLESQLFNVRPGDPIAPLLAILVLSITALAASALPARAAARVDPAGVLRTE